MFHCMQLPALAQPVMLMPSDSTFTTSVDSLFQGLEELKREREKIYEELEQLNNQLRAVENGFTEEFDVLASQHRAMSRNLEVSI